MAGGKAQQQQVKQGGAGAGAPNKPTFNGAAKQKSQQQPNGVAQKPEHKQQQQQPQKKAPAPLPASDEDEEDDDVSVGEDDDDDSDGEGRDFSGDFIEDAGFWSRVIEPNQEMHSIIPDVPLVLKLTAASLPFSAQAGGNERAALLLTSEQRGREETVVLCHLTSANPSTSLEVFVMGGQQIGVSVKGNKPIHLSGYLSQAVDESEYPYNEVDSEEEAHEDDFDVEDDEFDDDEDAEFDEDEEDEDEEDEDEDMEAGNSPTRLAVSAALPSIMQQLADCDDDDLSVGEDDEDEDDSEADLLNPIIADKTREKLKNKIKEVGSSDEEEEEEQKKKEQPKASPKLAPKSSPSLKPAATPNANKRPADATATPANTPAPKKQKAEEPAKTPAKTPAKKDAATPAPTTPGKAAATIKCTGCEKMFQSEQAMKQHAQTKHPEKK